MRQSTPFSRIHPYPAMVADSVAMALCQAYVRPGMRVLDPFCGTGRLVVSSAYLGAEAVGIDVNPLAVLISRAKRPILRTARIFRLLDRVLQATPLPSNNYKLEIEPGRSVSWFSPRVRSDLALLIDLINEAKLTHQETLACAALLSATAREVSYARQDQWKLHRLTAERRARYVPSTPRVFVRRAREFLRECGQRLPFVGSAEYMVGNSRDAEGLLVARAYSGRFDLVITSPPYGDSRTTVQYGAMSSLSLGVVRYIDKVRTGFLSGGEIDREALGGVLRQGARTDLATFWRGSVHRPEASRVSSFLDDFQSSLEQIGRLTHRNGRAIFIVGRRLVGGRRLQLDRFVKDVLQGSGFRLACMVERTLQGKLTPSSVNRCARASRKAKSTDHISTMKSEFVLVLERQPSIAAACPSATEDKNKSKALRRLIDCRDRLPE